MYPRAKYVMFANGPMVFGLGQTHSDVAEAMAPLMGSPISAGAIAWEDGEMFAFGESTSLGIKSRPEDTEEIANRIGAPVMV